MKKLLTSFATLTLVVGTFTQSTAWTQQNKQRKNIQNVGNNLNKDSKRQYFRTKFEEADPKSIFTKNYSDPPGILYYKNIVYAYISPNQVADKSELYESTDNGATWTEKLQTQNGSKINFAKVYNNVIYIGTGLDGLYESFDNGKTFTQNPDIYLPILSVPAEVDGITSNNKGEVFVYDISGTLWQSTDNGKTFHLNLSFTLEEAILGKGLGIWATYFYNNIFYFYVAHTSGYSTKDYILESHDNGNLFFPNYTFPTYHVFPPQFYGYNNTLYVWTYTDATLSHGSLWESTDFGPTTTTFYDDTQIQFNIAYIRFIYGYNNTLYVGTSVDGLWESTDNGTTFTQNTSVPSNYEVDSMYSYGNLIYLSASKYDAVPDPKPGYLVSKDGVNFNFVSEPDFYLDKAIFSGNDQGLIFALVEDKTGSYHLFISGDYASVDKPTQTKNIANLGQTYQYLIYSNPINFEFDWNWLSKVTIAETKTTLTSGTYQIKNNGTYTVTFTFKNSQIAPVTKRFALQNGYDFSQGLNMTTWNPSTRELDIEINKNIVNNFVGTYKSYSKGVIANINDNLNWSDLFSSKRLQTSIDNIIGSSHYLALNNNLSFPPKTLAKVEPNWKTALLNKINDLNLSTEGTAAKGLIFKVIFNKDFSISNTPDSEHVVIPLKDNQFKTNYWDQILFNQS